jgi:DNA-binding MarR family transcriptional regulator
MRALVGNLALDLTGTDYTGYLSISLVFLYFPLMSSVDVSLVASELRVAVGQLVRRLRAEHGFSLPQASVLGRLDREGARSTSDLATAERVRPQSMAQTVGELEEEDLISRRPDPEDGRRALLELTAKGRETLEADRRQRVGWLIQAITEELTEEEQAALGEAVALLARLAES